MKTPTLLSAIVLALFVSRQASYADMPKQKAELYDAAYSGDIEFLRGTFGDYTNGKANLPASPSDLIGEALAGHQYEIIKWCASENPDANKLSGWFGSKQMDVKAAKIIFDQVPSLKTNFVNKTMDGAIMIDNPELVKWLLASGLKPTNDRRPPAPLLAATQMRRMESISLLLKHGADPYELSPDHISPVGVAIAFKSSSLLKLLDKDKKYSVELSKIEQELRSPKDTAFSGTWADLHEGFGSASLTLYSDGTGVFGSDVGGMPCVLRNDGKTTKLILLQGQLIEGTKLDERQEVDIKTAGDDLVLVMGGEDRRLKKFNTKAPGVWRLLFPARCGLFPGQNYLTNYVHPS